jgi:hypothetical protein
MHAREGHFRRACIFANDLAHISRPGISPRDLVDLGYFGFDKK